MVPEVRDGGIVDNPFMIQGLQWDIFCKVIDNFGDIGVSWRLAADLAGRGHRVRLWVDDAKALAWMAAGGCERVRVLCWTACLGTSPANLASDPTDVLIEMFGCDIAPEFIATCDRVVGANGPKPLWINLEYLSAEKYVERNHALPSLTASGPAAGWTKWFFYPGFTELTGGLLREPGLVERQAGFKRSAWLAAQGIHAAGEKLVSMFCYEPALLASLLRQLAQHGLDGQPVRLLVTAGRPTKAVKAAFSDEIGRLRNINGCLLLSISYLALVTQPQFDHLLWACDLNFVRGEDSLVRAIWAGKPFVWHIYPQDDQAHLAKLDAFLDMLEAPVSLRNFHKAWNCKDLTPDAPGLPQIEQPEIKLPEIDLPGWQACALTTRSRLLSQKDLSTALIDFAEKTAKITGFAS